MMLRKERRHRDCLLLVSKEVPYPAEPGPERKEEISGPKGCRRAEWEYLMVRDFLDEIVEGGNSGMALLIH